MSVYNDIHILRRPDGGDDRIGIVCNPDQFTKDRVALDWEDYQRIVELAQDLGWEPKATKVKISPYRGF